MFLSALTSPFSMRTADGGDSVTVRVAGELDMSNGPLLAQALEEAARPGVHLTLDLEALEFIDCAGLRVLLAAHQAAAAQRWSLSVTPGRPQVQRLFALSGARHVLRVVPPPGLGPTV